MGYLKLQGYCAAALVAACLGQTAQAASCDLVPPNVAEMADTERAVLLQNGDFAQLDKEMAALMRKTGSSGRTDLHMLRDFDRLQTLGGNIKLFRAWADAFPQSFAAQFAAGLVHASAASEARGTEAASRTSANSFKEMERRYEVANVYLRKARDLNPKSALPYALWVVGAGEGGMRGTAAQEYLQQANQVDPKNMSARLQAANYFAPRWGGSFEQMDELVKKSQADLPTDHFKYLQYVVVMVKASHFEVIEKKPAEANALYAQAKKMCDNSETAKAGWGRTLR